jgi:hypothetical protein
VVAEVAHGTEAAVVMAAMVVAVVVLVVLQVQEPLDLMPVKTDRVAAALIQIP